MKKFAYSLIGLSLLGFFGSLFLNYQIPLWKAEVKRLLMQAKEAQFDIQKWESVTTQAENNLPSIYPINTIKKTLQETENMVRLVNQSQALLRSLGKNNPHQSINTEKIRELFTHIQKIEATLAKIKNNIDDIPESLSDPTEKIELENLRNRIQFLQAIFTDMRNFETIFQEFTQKQERVLLLLQNQNEPRPTGGFVGSVIIVDFSPEKIQWKFSDIYGLDRDVPAEIQDKAPTFFHDLSQFISLRDANLWPDFPTSADKYRKYFDALNLKVPDTVFAINLSVVREILEISGPITLDKWDITLDENNFDLALQFLVESKISGRYAVKRPVMDFAEKLITRVFEKMDTEDFVFWTQNFDFQEFVMHKNILAHSENHFLQKYFERWGIAGKVAFNPEADNILFFDFVSIGANKSEKFMRTKFWHDSKIYRDGLVENTLEITRTHELHPDEIQNLLHTNTWPENVRELLTDDILWKLGEGESRIMLRIYAPAEARLKTKSNPSGTINAELSEDEQFMIFYVPLNVTPGETVKAQLKYTTNINRGSANWRPYFLELLGTPGREEKTTFMETISTAPDGSFTAETNNIGRPQDLINQTFRAVVEFEDL